MKIDPVLNNHSCPELFILTEKGIRLRVQGMVHQFTQFISLPVTDFHVPAGVYPVVIINCHRAYYSPTGRGIKAPLNAIKLQEP